MVSKQNNRSLAWLAWAAVCVFWGTTFPAIHIMVRSLPPLLSSGFRQSAAGAILVLGGLLFGLAKPRGREWLDLLVASFLLVSLANGFGAYGVEKVNGSVATLTVATASFWMVGLEALRPQGERPGKMEIGGLLLGFLGLVVLALPESRKGLDYHLNLLALQGVAIVNAGGYVYLRQRATAQQAHPLMSAGLQLLMGGLVLTLFALLAGERPPGHFSGQGLWALAYLIAVGSLLGYSSYVYMISRLPVAIASLYVYLNPLVAVLIGWLWLQEKPTLRFWLGGAVILGGVALVQRGSRQRRSA